MRGKSLNKVSFSVVALVVMLMALMPLLSIGQTTTPPNGIQESGDVGSACASCTQQPQREAAEKLLYAFVVYNDPNWSGWWCYSDSPMSGNIHADCNDQTSSVALSAGWSVRLYRDQNLGGPSICLNRSDENLDNNTYADNSAMDNTASSFALYNQSWCGGPPSPAYPLEVYNDAGYSGSWCYSHAPMTANVASSCNDQISSILLRDGWSIRVYRDTQQGGPSRCLTGSDSNLTDNTFEDGSPMNDAISSFVLDSQPDCGGVPPTVTPPPPTVTPPPPDLGFRPYPNGYSFANYRATFPLMVPDFSKSDLRQMFGDSNVCMVVIGPLCLFKPVAEAWWILMNSLMNIGHCTGMSVTSLRFFKGLDSPSSFQAGADHAYDLSLPNVRRHIAWYDVVQGTNPELSYEHQSLQNSPSVILDQLSAAMSGSAPDPVDLVIRSLAGASHSITPYSIEDRGGNIYWVHVYDNNYPNDWNRHVIINTASNTWSYDLGWTTWTGDAASHSMGIVPISVYSAQPICPWCTGKEALSESTGQVWLTGQGHLLIMDSQMRRLGFDNGQFVDEIPGAAEAFADAGFGSIAEPIYQLPLINRNEYYIILDGAAFIAGEKAAVTQFGPGYVASAEGLTFTSTDLDTLIITPDGTQLLYNTATPKEITVVLTTEDAIQSHEFRAEGLDAENNRWVIAAVEPSSGQFTVGHYLMPSGAYDLSIERISTKGKQIFAHANVAMRATDTHYWNYAAWDGFGSMILEIDHDSNGSIDETLVMPNEASRVYLPFVVRSRRP